MTGPAQPKSAAELELVIGALASAAFTLADTAERCAAAANSTARQTPAQHGMADVTLVLALTARVVRGVTAQLISGALTSPEVWGEIRSRASAPSDMAEAIRDGYLASAQAEQVARQRADAARSGLPS